MAKEGSNKKNDGSTVAVRRLSINGSLNPSYEKDFPRQTEMTSKGLLTLGHFRPTASGPTFRARWGEEQTLLKFDVLHVSSEQSKGFKHGSKGCSGHHSNPVTSFTDSHLYDVDLAFYGNPIFKGTIQVGLTRAVGVTIAGLANVSVTATVIRGADRRRKRNIQIAMILVGILLLALMIKYL